MIIITIIQHSNNDNANNDTNNNTNKTNNNSNNNNIYNIDNNSNNNDNNDNENYSDNNNNFLRRQDSLKELLHTWGLSGTYDFLHLPKESAYLIILYYI